MVLYTGDRFIPYRVRPVVDSPNTLLSRRLRYALGVHHRRALQYTRNQTTVPFNERVVSHTTYTRPNKPIRVLDAPGLSADFYDSVISWGPANIAAIALGETIYIYNVSLQKIVKDRVHVSPLRCVGWRDDRVLLYANHGTLFCHDITSDTCYETMVAGAGTIRAKHTVTAVGTNAGVHLYDFRQHRAIKRIVLNQDGGDNRCGVEWSPHDDNLLLVGGNDNTVSLWDIRQAERSVATFRKHTAAVRGIAWCPHNAYSFCSGGGSGCKHLYMWNIHRSEAPTKSLNVNGQVCQLFWKGKYLITTEGFPSNAMNVWTAASMEHAATVLQWHNRLLHADMSPDGCQIMVGCGADAVIWVCTLFNPLTPSSRSSLYGFQMPVIR